MHSSSKNWARVRDRLSILVSLSMFLLRPVLEALEANKVDPDETKTCWIMHKQRPSYFCSSVSYRCCWDLRSQGLAARLAGPACVFFLLFGCLDQGISHGSRMTANISRHITQTSLFAIEHVLRRVPLQGEGAFQSRRLPPGHLLPCGADDCCGKHIGSPIGRGLEPLVSSSAIFWWFTQQMPASRWANSSTTKKSETFG